MIRKIQTASREAFASGQAGRATHARHAGRLRAVKERQARRENVPGPFYVDHTCIDCDTCRWMEPKVFARVNGMTAVVEQPTNAEDRLSAAQALLACPTHSIHLQNQNGEIKQAAQSFPLPIRGTQNLFHLGYHSEHSYGAASYLIKRENGNIMMDSPRFDKTLLKNIQDMGGAKYMVLSHKDDVCDHAKWAEALGLERIIHELEITRSQGTGACEVQLEGSGPWQLPDGDDNIQLISTPGHTEGHIVMLYRNPENPEEDTCFTGDHLGFTADGNLTIFKRYNRLSIQEQLKHVDSMKHLGFLHLLPGHGRPGQFCDEGNRIEQIEQVLAYEGYAT